MEAHHAPCERRWVARSKVDWDCGNTSARAIRAGEGAGDLWQGACVAGGLRGEKRVPRRFRWVGLGHPRGTSFREGLSPNVACPRAWRPTGMSPERAAQRQPPDVNQGLARPFRAWRHHGWSKSGCCPGLAWAGPLAPDSIPSARVDPGLSLVIALLEPNENVEEPENGGIQARGIHLRGRARRRGWIFTGLWHAAGPTTVMVAVIERLRGYLSL